MEKKDGIKDILKIIKLVYASVFIKNEKPLSLMLVAPPEQSKTHFILDYYKTKYIHIATDLSYKGLIKDLIRDNKIKQIIIPDFLKLTEKNQNTKKALITTLNAFLEEGIFNIDLANTEEINLKGRCGGIITSTTDASFYQNAKTWNAIGFKSRFLIISWKYTNETMTTLLEAISKEEKNKKNTSKTLNFKQKSIKIAEKTRKNLVFLAENSPRRLKNLKILIKSIALMNGKDEADDKEFEELKRLSKYINLRFNEI